MPQFHFPGVFTQIAALLLLAAAVGAVSLRLRQPLVLAFIGVGVLAGPSGLGWVKATEPIELLGELGLALLLFVVGLKMDIRTIRLSGSAALAVGGGQVLVTAGLGYLSALGLGWSGVPAAYIAISLVFSSTIVVVKLLSDKREEDSLHGRIAVGVLIIQDIIVVLVLSAVSGFGTGSGASPGSQALALLAKGSALLAGLALFSYLVLPRLLDLMARSVELLTLFAIAWAIGIGGLADLLGLTIEVGAFLAGVSLASTLYRELLAARLVGLRDFLLLFFFLELGARLDVDLLGARAWAAVPLSLFALVAKPLIVMTITGLMGYRKRTSFLTGVSLGQISEFSLVLVALGVQIGHLDQVTAGVIILVGLITIGVSSHLIIASHRLYDFFGRYAGVFERRIRHREEQMAGEAGHFPGADVILFGLGRYGSGVAQYLWARGRTILGVDFDPRVVRLWNQRGNRAVFGDAEDPDFAPMLPLSSARWVISSVREESINLALIRALRGHGYDGNIAVTAYVQSDAPAFLAAGADVVFQPFIDAAAQAVDILEMAEHEEVRRRMERLAAELNHHYIVCGYGRMGQHIVSDFQRYRVPYVVVEWNPEQTPKLVEAGIPHIEGRATDDETLIKAGVERARGLIAVTATDEENVFIVLSARSLNPRLYIVARSTQLENEGKLKRAGADKVMSPYVVGGHRMASAVLKPHATDFLDLLLQAEDGALEVSAIPVGESSTAAGRTVKDLDLRQTAGVTLLAIRRADGTFAANPDPDTVVQSGDDLVVLGDARQLADAVRVLG